MCATKHYDTDLSDDQWELIQSVLPEQKWKPGGSGRPPTDVRQALNKPRHNYRYTSAEIN